jgi:hypothetical protein
VSKVDICDSCRAQVIGPLTPIKLQYTFVTKSKKVSEGVVDFCSWEHAKIWIDRQEKV